MDREASPQDATKLDSETELNSEMNLTSKTNLNSTNLNCEMNVQFASLHDDGDDSEAKRSFYEISSDDGARPGSLIEDMYGVERRKNHPTKKIKMAYAEEKSTMDKNAVATGHTGLGQWIKEGEAKPSASDVVDLTKGMSTRYTHLTDTKTSQMF